MVVTRVLLGCYGCVTGGIQGVLHVCFWDGTEILQGCDRGVAGVLHGCHRDNTGMLEGC